MKRLVVLATVLLATGCGVRPSAVILGGPAPTAAAMISVYFVSDGRVTPVPRPDSASGLAQLAVGPTTGEREQGYTTEVPAGAVLDAAGSTVTVSVDVTSLSTNAATQIACTTAAGPVTLVGGGQRRGPLTCPVG
ncbi:hypothetical protein ACFFQW_37030 [Umezawaea endophytica]|uniref:Uncharacterized protein n=1 Tax=Umezawaea endophytica TaxID=1654476 RepID=A0A9X2VVA0_9PSEU|nr:hypothetical protein [Umezawaea endophytica]MCS7483334.1 hypothetical protein [Umezawaea endophytica]